MAQHSDAYEAVLADLARDQGWKPGDPIGYVRKEIPAFESPGYPGERYEAQAPDTLDLQERARLAINALTGATDPLADHEIYVYVRFVSNLGRPMMLHDFNSICQCKFMESLPLMRIISGSDQSVHVDRRWMEVLLHQIGPDGLAYWPTKGRPWTWVHVGNFVPADVEMPVEQVLAPMYCARALSAVMIYHRRDQRSLWNDVAERMVDGLVDLAVDKGDYAYFAPNPVWAVKGSTEDGGREVPVVGAHCCFIILSLVHVYRELGYEPALDLAGKLINYVLKEIRYIDEGGEFMSDLLGTPKYRPRVHFHTHTYLLLAVLEYARVANDVSLLELVRRGYEFGKANGEVLLGYFPERLGSRVFEHSELCEVADMIALGLKLTAAGVGDYWDDVDRWTRNMFAEGQLTKIDWLDRIRLAGPADELPERRLPGNVLAPNETTDRVAERNLGAFAGWPTPNDWYDGVAYGIQHCCTGNGTRAIYYLWEHMLTYDEGKLRVNLLLNRPSCWADVDSHLPYTGQVDVRIKQALELSIRIPEWVSPEEARCTVNGTQRGLRWDGRYAVVGAVAPGDQATLTFPISERTDVVWVEKRRYTIVRRGNEVVDIDPPGRYCPLYQRGHYRQDSTRWRKIERFVSDETILW